MMSELTPEAKETIRKFLEERDWLFIRISISAVVTLLLMMGAFLAFLYDAVGDRAELAAANRLDVRITQFEQEISVIRAELVDDRVDYNKAISLIEVATKEVAELREIAAEAISDINRAQGSLIFAETITEIRRDIATLEAKLVPKTETTKDNSDDDLPAASIFPEQ